MRPNRSRRVRTLFTWVIFLGIIVAAGDSVGLLDPTQVPNGEKVVGEVGSLIAGLNSTMSPSEPQPTVSKPPNTQSDNKGGLNQSRLEYAIHEQINEVRDRRGLTRLRFDTALRAPARYHSQDMAANDYFAHESPSGGTVQDRYDRFNYECRVSMGGLRYATGGENIARTWYRESVRTDNGTVYYDSIDGLAEGIVRQWMNSPGHRKNILREFWQTEAIGVAVVEVDGKVAVYATQNFC